MKRGKREAVRVGQEVICSQLSCAGGRVEREGESRGENRDEMTKENEESTRGRRALRCGRFRSDPSLNARQSLQWEREKRVYAVPFMRSHQTTSQVVSDAID